MTNETMLRPLAGAARLTHTSSLILMGKTAVSDCVVELEFEHAQKERLPPWTPGSHIDLMLPSGVTRQYSLCGDRWDNYRYTVSVLREEESRGGSSYVHDVLKIGDVVGFGGPRNLFHMVPARKFIFIAGGIGITPIISMIQQAEKLGVDWELHYCGRSRSTMAYASRLETLGDQVKIIASDEGNRLDLDALLAQPEDGVVAYCCGPAHLLDAVGESSAHWPAHRVRMERFAATDYGESARKTSFEVEMARSGKTVTVEPDVSILDAVRSAGAKLLSSCGQGTCGTCEVAVLDGSPEHRDSLFTGSERAANDRLLTCVSRCLSDRIVLDL